MPENVAILLGVVSTAVTVLVAVTFVLAVNYRKARSALRKTEERLGLQDKRILMTRTMLRRTVHDLASYVSLLPSRIHEYGIRDIDGSKLQALIEAVRAAAARLDDVPRERIDLAKVVRAGVEQFKRDVRAVVPVNIEAPDEPVTVLGPQSQLMLLFRELLRNSLDAKPDLLKVHVRIARLAPGDPNPIDPEMSVARALAFVRYEDNGPGIPADAKEEVFKAGWTAKQGRTSSELSGLSGIRTYLDLAYGGRIAEIGREGQGAVFAITIPLPD